MRGGVEIDSLFVHGHEVLRGGVEDDTDINEIGLFGAWELA